VSIAPDHGAHQMTEYAGRMRRSSIMLSWSVSRPAIRDLAACYAGLSPTGVHVRLLGGGCTG
jgi:hypothetical protein